MAVQVEFVSANQDDCDRSHARRRLRLPLEGSIKGGGALLHNLSESGLLLETSDELAVDEVIQVDLPDAGERPAKVVWHSGQLFGCQFLQPISKGAVSASVLRASPIGMADSVFPPPHVERLSLRSRTLLILALALGCWAILASMSL